MVDDHLQNEGTYCGSLVLLEKGPLGVSIPSKDDEKTVGYARPVYCHYCWCKVVFPSNSDCCFITSIEIIELVW